MNEDIDIGLEVGNHTLLGWGSILEMKLLQCKMSRLLLLP